MNSTLSNLEHVHSYKSLQWVAQEQYEDTQNPIKPHITSNFRLVTSLVVKWSEVLTTDHEVPGSTPSSAMGRFPEGEDSHGEHGLGSLLEF
jgi:hypothetical protein